jgi:hypothetical protein
MAIGIIGYSIIIWEIGWLASLGIVLSIMGNNMEQLSRRR